jgi:hypothetical protein
MKPTIYFLDNNSGQGLPKVIRGLANKLFLYSADFGLEMRPIDILGDLIIVAAHPTLNIGLLSHENEDQSVDELMRFLNDEKCDVIFCTSIDREVMDKSIARFVSSGKYQSVYLKNVFSSLIELNQLLEHEILKLYEMIELFLEYSPSVSSDDQMQTSG